jgi:hypothetical protein
MPQDSSDIEIVHGGDHGPTPFSQATQQSDQMHDMRSVKMAGGLIEQ